MNELDDKRRLLSPVSYERVYQLLEKEIKETNLIDRDHFTLFSTNLLNSCKKITDQLLSEIKESNFFSVFQMDGDVIYRNFVSLNFQDIEKENKAILHLEKTLQEVLESKHTRFNRINPLEELIFSGNDPQKIRNSQTVPFTVKTLKSKKPVSVGKLKFGKTPDTDKKLLRHDSVKIKYPEEGRLQSIKKSIISFYEESGEYDENIPMRNFLFNQIENEGYLAQDLNAFIEKNKIGAVKRHAAFLYLDFIADKANMSIANQHKEGISLVKRYTSRFENLELLYDRFLKEAKFPGKELFGKSRDILNYLRMTDALGFLPFLGVFSEIMVATRSEGNNIEQYGVGLKLNGVVQHSDFEETNGIRSFNHHVEKIKNHSIRGENSEHFKSETEAFEKLWKATIRVALLKYFLMHLDKEDYDPTDVLIKDLERIYQYDRGLALEDTYEWYKEFVDDFLKEPEFADMELIPARLEVMGNMLQSALTPFRNELPQHELKKTYTRRLTFLKSIFKDHLFSNDPTVFVGELATHNYKHTILTPEPASDSLFSLEYEIEFSSKFLYPTNETESIDFEYRTYKEKDQAMCVFFLPCLIKKEVNKNTVEFTPETTEYLRSEESRSLNKILIPFPVKSEYEKESLGWFLYTFVYKLYVFLFLHTYTKKVGHDPKHLSLFFWSLHEKKMLSNYEKEPYTWTENMIQNFRKELDFLFGNEHITGNQGYDLGTGNHLYKVQNALSSMYLNVPKMYRLQEPIKTDKIAIIVLTSYKTDTEKKKQLEGYEQYKTGLFGEIFTIQSQTKNGTNYSLFKRERTFFDHSDEKIYQQSNVLETTIKELAEAGYKEILYIAKTPFTTKFLNKEDRKKELYFMNPELMESFQLNHKVSVYPIHFSTTRAYEIQGRKREKEIGMYLDDTSHIQKNLFEGHEGIVVFFQLYSGVSINKKSIYNSLVTYQTLNRIYEDEILNSKITSNLINPDGIKLDLIRALILLHTSRNEKNTDIRIKVDPYDHLLGDEGVAKRSVLEIKPYKNKTVQFNSLAYLEYVKEKVLEQANEGECNEKLSE